MEVGDVVLLKDQEIGRLNWPMGIVERVFASGDKRVRKVEVRIVKDGKIVKYVRPVVEMVLLLRGSQ